MRNFEKIPPKKKKWPKKLATIILVEISDGDIELPITKLRWGVSPRGFTKLEIKMKRKWKEFIVNNPLETFFIRISFHLGPPRKTAPFNCEPP